MFLLIGKDKYSFGKAGRMIMVEKLDDELLLNEIWEKIDLENRVYYDKGEWVDLQVMKILGK